MWRQDWGRALIAADNKRGSGQGTMVLATTGNSCRVHALWLYAPLCSGGVVDVLILLVRSPLLPASLRSFEIICVRVLAVFMRAEHVKYRASLVSGGPLGYYY